MELNQGYKQTEVGIIPVDWKCLPLTDLVYYIHGKAHEQYIEEFGKYIVVNSKFISTDGNIKKFSNISFCTAIIGDILTVLSDLPNGKALAKCFVVNQNNTFAVNQRVCIWRPKSHVHSMYLFYLLNRNRYFLSLNDGVSQTHILNHHIEKCRIQLPDNEREQISIATALSNIDELISQTEKLISKKKAIKQGVMQELLKPNEGWVTKKLGDVAELITKGTTPTSLGKDFQTSGINFIKIESLTSTGEIIPNKLAFIDESTHQLLKRSQLKYGDILFSIAGALGRVAIVENDILPANTNQALAIIRLNINLEIDLKYIFIYLTSRPIQTHILNVSVQGAQANLSLLNISQLLIEMPISKLEQTRIATILSNMDNEITFLEKKLSKRKMLKQGMMQALLTGKIRLL
jgi:type I restriction enzyme S subunit